MERFHDGYVGRAAINAGGELVNISDPEAESECRVRLNMRLKLKTNLEDGRKGGLSRWTFALRRCLECRLQQLASTNE